jgi:hypothetical protein
MKAAFFSQVIKSLALILAMAATKVCAQNQIYGYATPGAQFAFVVTNIPAAAVYPGTNPGLILTAGATYRFVAGTTAGFHPVLVATNASQFNSSYNGASPNNIAVGTITVTLPATNYPAVLYYVCGIHGFFGRIDILPPPAPRQIDAISVTTNIVLMSSGVSNTWALVPEFSSNLVDGAWSPVAGFTNLIVNGTNATTTFGLLDPICGPNVFLRLRQSPP